MINKDKNIITVADEDGNKKEYTILLSFDTDDDKVYYIYTNDEFDNEGFIKTYAGIYDNTDGIEKLLPIESEEEWELIETLVENLNK